jgi:pyocin large subunit-like protein
MKGSWLLCAAAAVAMLTGCERSSAVADRDHPDVASSRSGEDRGGVEQASRDAAYDRPDAVQDRRAAPVPEIDGKPMWSASRRYSAQESAQRAFEKNGQDFGARDLDDYVRQAHAFVDSPPKGVQTLARANGDTLFYDPKANVFAVANRDGAPRTLFKPREGAAYWTEQKSREASRRAERRTSDAG